MAKLIDFQSNELVLNDIKNNTDEIRISVGEPVGADPAARYTWLTANSQIVITGVVAGDFTGPIDGVVGTPLLGARRITTGAYQNATVSGAGGDVDHVSLCDSGTGRVKYTTQLPLAKTVANGESYDLESFDCEIVEPV